MASKAEGPVYADSSFLISLYSPDSNTGAAALTMRRVPEALLITPLVEFEVINALRQRIFWRQISELEAQKSQQKFDKNLHDGAFRMLALPESMFARAKAIAEQTTATLGTRTIDLLHVASALELGAIHLYSFDERQRKLATAVRLKLNPVT